MGTLGIVLHLGTLESPCTHCNYMKMEMQKLKPKYFLNETNTWLQHKLNDICGNQTLMKPS